MHVLATRVATNVSLTLVNDARGWRFHSWKSADRDADLGTPPARLCEQCFPTADLAAAFFEHFWLSQVARRVGTAREESAAIGVVSKDDDDAL